MIKTPYRLSRNRKSVSPLISIWFSFERFVMVSINSAALLDTEWVVDSLLRTFSAKSSNSCRFCADSALRAANSSTSGRTTGSPGTRTRNSSRSREQQGAVKCTPSRDSSTEKSEQTTRFDGAARKACRNSWLKLANSIGNQLGFSRINGGITKTWITQISLNIFNKLTNKLTLTRTKWKNNYFKI